MRSNKMLLVVIIAVFVSVFFLILRSVLKNHEIYTQSVGMVKTNENVIALLGEPIKTSFIFSGSLRNGNYARYKIFFKGPKGKGSVSIKAYKEQGGWQFDKAIFSSQGIEINFLAENNSNPILSDTKESKTVSNIILYTLITVVSILFFVFFLQYILKSHEVYKRAVEMVKTNNDISTLLGEPITTSFLVNGALKNMKYAKYGIRFNGLNGKGSLSVVANKELGEWHFEKTIFKSQGKEINLLADNIASEQKR